MSYKFYEVDLTFVAPTGTTMPITAESEDQARAIAIDLFSDYDKLEVAAVRYMGTPGTEEDSSTQQPSSLLVN